MILTYWIFIADAGQGLAEQIGMTHFYHIFYEGCLYSFEIGDDGREATTLYPDVKYTTVETYLKRFL